ncbi:MAG: ABC transporter ATP-binding protein [Parascardovia denticolens]
MSMNKTDAENDGNTVNGRNGVGTVKEADAGNGEKEAGRPLLEVKEIGKRYAGSSQPAVDRISFRLFPGQALALVGESGSGKSTTLRLALGLDQADQGQVFFEGRSLDQPAVSSDLRAQTGLVFQNPFTSLNPRWTVASIVSEPLLIKRRGERRMGKEEVWARVLQALTQVSLDPRDFLGRFPQDLSGGQAQRVAMARALVRHPRLFVADEPVSAVDVGGRLSVVRAFQGLKEEGKSLLLVLHDLGVAQQLADWLMVMRQGRLVEEGTAEDVIGRPQQAYTRQLLAAAEW